MLEEDLNISLIFHSPFFLKTLLKSLASEPFKDSKIFKKLPLIKYVKTRSSFFLKISALKDTFLFLGLAPENFK